MRTEKQLHTYIKKLCQSKKVMMAKIHAENRSGWPDLILIHKGYVIFMELKAPSGTGVLSARQIITIDRMRANGAEVYVCDSQEKADFIVESLINREPTTSHYKSL